MKKLISINSFRFWIKDEETKDYFEFKNFWVSKDDFLTGISLKMIAKVKFGHYFTQCDFYEFVKKKFNKENFNLVAVEIENEGQKFFFDPIGYGYDTKERTLASEYFEKVQNGTKAKFEIFGFGGFLATQAIESIEAFKNGTYENKQSELLKLWEETKIRVQKTEERKINVEEKGELLKNFCFSAMAEIRDFMIHELKITDYKNDTSEIGELRKKAIKVLCPAAKTKNLALIKKTLLLIGKNYFSNLFKDYENLKSSLLNLERVFYE